LVCKPVATDLCSCYDHRELGKESSNSISSSVAAPHIRYDFLCYGGAANIFQVLLKAQENRYRNTKCLKLFTEVGLKLICMSLDILKDLERDFRTTEDNLRQTC
jgi:hypothetical protein